MPTPCPSSSSGSIPRTIFLILGIVAFFAGVVLWTSRPRDTSAVITATAQTAEADAIKLFTERERLDVLITASLKPGEAINDELATLLKDLEETERTINEQYVPVGEYYAAPHLKRPGVYSLTERTLTLTQAIVSAGMFDEVIDKKDEDRVVIEIARRASKREKTKWQIPWLDLKAHRYDVVLRPDDLILAFVPKPVTQPAK